MSYPQPRFYRSEGHQKEQLITFCSCQPCRTELEQIPTQREMTIMWLKDAAAGLSLVVFLASAYLIVPAAQMLLSSF